MKILFSPSETKTLFCKTPPLNPDSFIFPDLYKRRLEVLERYHVLLQTANEASLRSLFGLKDISLCKEWLQTPLFDAPTCKAIERYSGVAYDYLDYASLNPSSQLFLDQNVMIFSNLFGPILAQDEIPNYRVHQGASLEGFKPETFYHACFSQSIDEWIANETLLDLRAGFYEKFYMPQKPYITMKFLKGGKVVSHFAKAYRGKVLRQIAYEQPVDDAALQTIAFEHLRIVEIHRKKLKHEYVYEIID